MRPSRFALATRFGSGLQVGGLLLTLATSACDWRKPLPRDKDAGPPVELVAARPNLPTAHPGAPLPPTPPSIPFVDEHEPNDDREHAQPVELLTGAGKGVHGSLAPPTELGAGLGAEDFYAVTMPAGSSPNALEQLHAELSGSPQADLSLELFDGEPLKEAPPPGYKPMAFAHIDERGRGEPERVSIGVRPLQKLLLRVRGNVASGAKPEAFAYQLRLQTTPAPAGNEVEPNETPELATPATVADLSGTLPWHGDEDFWVINLADALARRPTAAAATKGPAPAGIKDAAILRIELRTPGATPELRVLLLDGAAKDAVPADSVDVPSFRKLKFLLDLTAPKGASELRLRNVGLPAGSARAYIGVHTAAPPVAKGPSEPPRYQLRLTVEPALDDAESEPNDDCATQANLLTLSAQSGGAAEGQSAGFLWPTDSDCFRLRGGATGQRHTVQLQLPGAGSDCKATLEWVRSDGIDSLPNPADGGAAAGLLLRGRAHADALFRVYSRDNKTCFDVPYRLTVRSEADRP